MDPCFFAQLSKNKIAIELPIELPIAYCPGLGLLGALLPSGSGLDCYWQLPPIGPT